jgi:hypothetical protein
MRAYGKPSGPAVRDGSRVAAAPGQCVLSNPHQVAFRRRQESLPQRYARVIHVSLVNNPG